MDGVNVSSTMVGANSRDHHHQQQHQQHQHHQQQQQQHHNMPVVVGGGGQASSVSVQKLVRRGHQLELLQQAKRLCDQQDYVDLTIYCEDGVVRAHQMLLATASPFLKLLFQSSPLYGVDEISLILPEVKACLVQALVHFVYTGTVVSKEDHFYSLMKLVYALNINASIEAESTNEKPTTFNAPLAYYIESPSRRKLPAQQQLHLQQQQQHHHTMFAHPQLPTTPLAQSSIMQHQLPTQPMVSLPTHPVPQAKVARMSHQMNHPGHQQQQHKQMSIQLPTHPVPLAGMVNGGLSQAHLKSDSVGSYIAVDPNTGLSYKVEVPNGPGGSHDASDPLAAIMNETIFTDSSGATIYAGENGTVVYSTSHGHVQTAHVLSASVPVPAASVAGTSSATPAKGKKRKAGNKENQILAESVDDLPCTPDDEDINTPYPCEHCNKTIKGKVMLQAHQYQEHYDNPELNRLDLGDKHACRVCLKLFTRNSDVKAHILRVHCGDRRYPCTMCGKRFKESTHLRKHLYTHTGERPHYCTLCSKGFQTSSDLKRHKRTKVHQERVEQINASGGHLDESKDDDGEGGEYNQWAEDDEDEDDEESSSGGANKTGVDNTAQALLNSITQPLGGGGGPPSATATSGAFSSGSSTIDMKALSGPGSSNWNNNQQQQSSTSVPSAAAASGSNSSSSTLDLKAIGSSTVDMNALKWQRRQQPQQQQQAPPPAAAPGAASAAATSSAASSTATVPQVVAVKRSSSVDSPGQDEERLTVVEGDDSSQDSVQQAAAAASNATSNAAAAPGGGAVAPAAASSSAAAAGQSSMEATVS